MTNIIKKNIALALFENYYLTIKKHLCLQLKKINKRFGFSINTYGLIGFMSQISFQVKGTLFRALDLRNLQNSLNKTPPQYFTT